MNSNDKFYWGWHLMTGSAIRTINQVITIFGYFVVAKLISVRILTLYCEIKIYWLDCPIVAASILYLAIWLRALTQKHISCKVSADHVLRHHAWMISSHRNHTTCEWEACATGTARYNYNKSHRASNRMWPNNLFFSVLTLCDGRPPHE